MKYQSSKHNKLKTYGWNFPISKECKIDTQKSKFAKSPPTSLLTSCLWVWRNQISRCLFVYFGRCYHGVSSGHWLHTDHTPSDSLVRAGYYILPSEYLNLRGRYTVVSCVFFANFYCYLLVDIDLKTNPIKYFTINV